MALFCTKLSPAFATQFYISYVFLISRAWCTLEVMQRGRLKIQVLWDSCVWDSCGEGVGDEALKLVLHFRVWGSRPIWSCGSLAHRLQEWCSQNRSTTTTNTASYTTTTIINTKKVNSRKPILIELNNCLFISAFMAIGCVWLTPSHVLITHVRHICGVLVLMFDASDSYWFPS